MNYAKHAAPMELCRVYFWGLLRLLTFRLYEAPAIDAQLTIHN